MTLFTVYDTEMGQHRKEKQSDQFGKAKWQKHCEREGDGESRHGTVRVAGQQLPGRQALDRFLFKAVAAGGRGCDGGPGLYAAAGRSAVEVPTPAAWAPCQAGADGAAGAAVCLLACCKAASSLVKHQ
jgi:hypothetical protein